MRIRTKNVLLFLVVVFIIYAVVTSPQLAADYVEAAFVFLADIVSSVFTFFGELLR